MSVALLAELEKNRYDDMNNFRRSSLQMENKDSLMDMLLEKEKQLALATLRCDILADRCNFLEKELLRYKSLTSRNESMSVMLS